VVTPSGKSRDWISFDRLKQKARSFDRAFHGKSREVLTRLRPRRPRRHRPFSRFASISGICKVVAAFARLDGGDEVTEVSPSVFEGALLRDAHPVLDLGEGLLDRIEVG
jgi:hypothetical protein